MGVFINYRTGDGEQAAAELDTRLSEQFGADRVFLARRSIELGRDYRPQILGRVEGCDVLLAVIGPDWLERQDGRRRIDDPEDWVRREIALALEKDKVVIPILLPGAARLSVDDDLPDDIADLAIRQHLRVADHDVEKLVLRIVGAAPGLGVGVVPGVVELGKWWSGWSRTSDPAIPVDLPLAGRSEEVESLSTWLEEPASVLTLCSTPLDGGAAFVSAAVGRERPAVFVTEIAGAEHCVKLIRPVLVVVRCEGVDHRALVSRGHHVVILRRQSDPLSVGLSLILPRLSFEPAQQALLSAGIPAEKSHQLAGVARRSLLALRRRLDASMPAPGWSTAELAVPVLLAGAWATSEKSRDFEEVVRLAGCAVQELQRFVDGTAATDDPLLHRSGTRWQLADPSDAWSVLHHAFDAAVLKRWHEIALDVLTTRDPLTAVLPSERLGAQMRGIRREHSDELRLGLARGAALLGAAGDRRLANGRTAQEHASVLVREALARCNEDRSGGLWLSIAEALPLLAEAAPAEFLFSVDTALHGENPVVLAMFEDVDGTHRPGRFSAHTHLLWALETLCWSPSYLAYAVRLLGGLAALDPGGPNTSRPSDSLRRVLSPLNPCTFAPAVARLQAIDVLRVRQPEVWWSLLLEMLSMRGDQRTRQPEFRDDWMPDSPAASPAGADMDEIVSRVLSGAEEASRRWPFVVGRILALAPPQRELVIQALSKVDGLSEDEALALRNAIVDLVTMCETLGSDLPSDSLERLAACADRMDPVHLPQRYARLFDHRPVLPGVDQFDLETYDRELERLRLEALRAVVGTSGLEGLVLLAECCAQPDVVGDLVVGVTGDELVDEVVLLLGSPSAVGLFAQGFVGRLARDRGTTWVLGVADRMTTWSPDAQTGFLLAASRSVDVSAVIAVADRSAEDSFWLRVPCWPPVGEPVAFYTRLLEHRRPWSAIRGLSLALHPQSDWTPSATLAVEALRAAVSGAIVEQLDRDMSVFAVGKLLDHVTVADGDSDQVIHLELAFGTFLYQRRPPAALYRRISRSPATFVDLVRMVVGNGGENSSLSGNAHSVLHGWRSPVPDPAWWVGSVRTLVAGEGRVQRLAEKFAGQGLTGDEVDPDGAWPVAAVRDLLDEPGNDQLVSGFLMGITNNRGTTTREAYDGGGQERRLASDYLTWADAIMARWPRAAEVLRCAAARTESYARGWDDDAEDTQDEV